MKPLSPFGQKLVAITTEGMMDNQLAELRQLREALQASYDDNDALTWDLTQVENKCSENETIIARLEETIADLQRQVSRSQAEVVAARCDLQSRNDMSEQRRRSGRDVGSQIDVPRSRPVSIQCEIQEDLESMIKLLQADLTAKDALHVRLLEEEKRSIREHLEDLAQQHHQDLEKLRSEKLEAVNQANSATERYKEDSSKIAELKGQNASLAQMVDVTQKQLSRSNAEVITLRGELRGRLELSERRRRSAQDEATQASSASYCSTSTQSEDATTLRRLAHLEVACQADDGGRKVSSQHQNTQCDVRELKIISVEEHQLQIDRLVAAHKEELTRVRDEMEEIEIRALETLQLRHQDALAECEDLLSDARKQHKLDTEALKAKHQVDLQHLTDDLQAHSDARVESLNLRIRELEAQQLARIEQEEGEERHTNRGGPSTLRSPDPYHPPSPESTSERQQGRPEHHANGPFRFANTEPSPSPAVSSPTPSPAVSRESWQSHLSAGNNSPSTRGAPAASSPGGSASPETLARAEKAAKIRALVASLNLR